MTRGTLVLVTAQGMEISTEFNGDMYMESPYGHGAEVVERLKRVTDVQSFVKEVAEFNKNNFKYEEELTYHNDTSIVDCKEDTYFDTWFSDYLYVKNIDSKNHTVIDYSGVQHSIKPNEILVLDFGNIENRF